MREIAGERVGMIGAGESAPSQALSRQQAWRCALASLLLGVCGLVWVFWAPLEAMVGIWLNSPSFGHGFVIVLIAIAIAVVRRERTAAEVPRPCFWGLAFALVGSLIGALATLASVQLVQQLAFLLLFQALVLTVLGIRATRTLAFPLGFLVFAIPMGTALVPFLQRIAAELTIWFLGLFDITAVLEGYLIRTPVRDYRIAEACAGLRFSLVGLAMSVLIAAMLLRTWPRRVAFLAVAMLVPPVANALRAAIAIALGEGGVIDAGSLFSHFSYGLGFTGLVMICLLLLALALRRGEVVGHPLSIPAPTVQAVSPVTALSYPLAAFGIVAIAILPALAFLGGSAPPGQRSLMAAPVLASPWRGVDTQDEDWRPAVLGADKAIRASYTDGAVTIDFFAAHFLEQKQGSEVVSEVNRSRSLSGWEIAASSPAGQGLSDRVPGLRGERLISENGQKRWAWLWYRVAETATADPFRAKLLQLKTRMLGMDPAAAVIVVSVQGVPDQADAEMAAERFLAALPPTESWLLAGREGAGREGGE